MVKHFNDFMIYNNIYFILFIKLVRNTGYIKDTSAHEHASTQCRPNKTNSKIGVKSLIKSIAVTGAGKSAR